MIQTQPAMVSIGDEGALNTELKPSLSEIWIDRDLSWLDFNQRVLAEALDDRTPLLERAKFLAIFTSNLDEFFMKRVAVLRHSSTLDSAELRRQIREKVSSQLSLQADFFRDHLVSDLAQNGIHLCSWHELTDAQRNEANQFFDEQVSAAVTPLVISPSETFPFLSNLSTSLVFSLEDPVTSQRLFGRVKVPSNLRQWIQLRSDTPAGQFLFVRLHELIRENLQKLYAGMTLAGITSVRISREVEVETKDGSKASVFEKEEPEASLFEQVRLSIQKRRFQPVVRLECAQGADPSVVAMLSRHFHLSPDDIYEDAGELDYTSLFEIAGLDVITLKDKPWVPVTPPALRDRHKDIFSVIRTSDMLVHHPYESFDASVERFIESASKDPQTIAIKMTVYRVGDDTPFVKSLIKAAEAGKQVACVIELHARFDEERNLHWAAALEKAGAHVDFGVKGLKIHGKTAMVVRKESDGLRTYVHIGTGNYHVRTARLYADFGLFTCNPELTHDVVWLFHYLTGHSASPDCKHLLVAPKTMRPRFLELIHREIQIQRREGCGRIIGKMNQLEDPAIIEALIEASIAGVSIDLVIRGFCCLKPGVPGLTENIRVRSIIGRFLEHSRIYYFGAGAASPLEGEFYIGSADWMYRNLSKRVEVVTPVSDKAARERLWETLQINLRDRREAWTLGADGSYTRAEPPEMSSSDSHGTHGELMELASR